MVTQVQEPITVPMYSYYDDEYEESRRKAEEDVWDDYEGGPQPVEPRKSYTYYDDPEPEDPCEDCTVSEDWASWVVDMLHDVTDDIARMKEKDYHLITIMSNSDATVISLVYANANGRIINNKLTYDPDGNLLDDK